MGASGLIFKGLLASPNEKTSSDVAIKELVGELDDEFLVEVKLLRYVNGCLLFTAFGNGNLEMVLTSHFDSALKHPYVIELIGVSISEETGRVHLVEELMHLGNLRELLDKKGQLMSWKVRLKLARDAARGMAFLHRRKIIHRYESS